MKWILSIVTCLGVIGLLITGIMSLSRQQAPQPVWIYYTSDNNPRDLYRVRFDGTGQEPLLINTGFYEFAGFDAESFLYRTGRFGTPSRLFRTSMHVNSDPDLLADAVDGRLIAWQGDWLYYYFSTGHPVTTYRVNAITGEQQMLVDTGSDRHVPLVVLPDGTLIYQRMLDTTTLLWTASPDRHAPLIEIPPALIRPQLVVDGEWLYFAARDAGVDTLYKMRVDGSQLLPLMTSPKALQIDRWHGDWLYVQGLNGILHRVNRTDDTQRLVNDMAWICNITTANLQENTPVYYIAADTLFYADFQTGDLMRLDLSAPDAVPQLAVSIKLDTQQYANWVCPRAVTPSGSVLAEYLRDGQTLALVEVLPDGSTERIDIPAHMNFVTYLPERDLILLEVYDPAQRTYHLAMLDRGNVQALNRPTFDGYDFIAWSPVIDLAWQPMLGGAFGLLLGVLIVLRRIR